MEKYTSDLLADMHIGLQKVALEAENNLQLAERSYNLVESKIELLKDYIIKYPFKDKGQEITFFKEIKPLFQKEMIYYLELFSIEAGKPQGTKKMLKSYYNKHLIAIELFFTRNQKFYNYYQGSKDYLDEAYYLRESNKVADPIVHFQDLDRNSTTPYSNTLSTLLAYERLREFLQHSLMPDSASNASAVEKKKRNVTWTDSKAALIELVYALHSRGSVNFGNISVKQLVADVEEFFNISLGNVYTSLLTMGIRKKARTPYLNSLIQSLENKLDEKDE